MNKGDKILEQFDSLPGIEASSNWNDRMMQRLEHAKPARQNAQANLIVLIAVVTMMSFAVFSITFSWVSINQKHNITRLENIAGEFFINSESSKY